MCCESWWYCWQFNHCVAMTTLHPSKRRTSKILVSAIKTAVHHEAAQRHNATVKHIGAGDQVMNVVGVVEMREANICMLVWVRCLCG